MPVSNLKRFTPLTLYSRYGLLVVRVYYLPTAWKGGGWGREISATYPPQKCYESKSNSRFRRFKRGAIPYLDKYRNISDGLMELLLCQTQSVSSDYGYVPLFGWFKMILG